MKRIAIALAVLSLAVTSVAAPVGAQPLLNGVYSVTVSGSATQAVGLVPGSPFTMQGLLFVLPSSLPQFHPVEMCLFVNGPLQQAQQAPLSLTGSIWLASWLRCGARLAQGGLAFSSLDTHSVGSVVLSADKNTVLVIPPLGSLGAAQQEEGFLVFENIFPTGQSTPNEVTGGAWFATTTDNGQTVKGSIQLQGVQAGQAPGVFGLSLARYSATFNGTLIFRLQ